MCLYAAKLCFNNLHMINYAQLFVTRLQWPLLSLRRGTREGSRALKEERSAGNDGKKEGETESLPRFPPSHHPSRAPLKGKTEPGDESAIFSCLEYNSSYR